MEEKKFICEGGVIPNDPYLDAYDAVNEVCYHGLPHWHQDKKLQFVTFRLADSLPQSKLEELIQEKIKFLRLHPQPWNNETYLLFHKKYGFTLDKWLDAGLGCCVLKNPDVRKVVTSVY